MVRLVEGAVTKPVDEWNHADANAFTEALAEQVEAHKDDPEAVEAMLTLAGPRLQRSAELLGEATQTGGLSESDVEGISENFISDPVGALEDAGQNAIRATRASAARPSGPTVMPTTRWMARPSASRGSAPSR